MAFGLDDALAIGGFAADVGGTIASAFGQERANKQNIALAREQMAFQEYSAKHRYQWTMEDMRKAGLNPILAYQQGGGAALGGAMGRVEPIVKDSTSAKNALATSLAIKEAQARIANLNEDTVKKRAEGYLTDTMAAKNIKEQKILEQTEVSARATAAADAAKEKFYNTRLGEIMRQIDLIGKSLNPFAGAASSARSATR